MGITDFFSDMMSYLPTLQEAHADAPAEEEEEPKEEGESEEKEEGGEEQAEEGGDDAEEEEAEEEEEEEEEEEPVDPKPQLEADCAKSAQCIGYKHHYDECVERVTSQQESGGKGKEDCVEEFFHLQHCATQCAAPKLFKMLK